MNYYDDDRWEFDPEGEGGIAPDPPNSMAADDGSYGRGEDAIDGHAGYPGTPRESGRGDEQAKRQCGCGTPIDPGQTKCDFCLSERLDYEKSADTDTDPDREITGVIHVLVDANSEANAVCIAQTVFKDIVDCSSAPSVEGIDEYELIAVLSDDLANRFAREWGQLPAGAPVASSAGQRQLDTIRQNAGHDYLLTKDGNSEDNRPTLDPVLFDADGEPITGIEEVGALIAGGSLRRTQLDWETDNVNDDPAQTWIVPAIALRHVSQPEPEGPSHEGRKRRTLACLDCGDATRHTFAGWNDVPHPEFEATPIWECTRCQSPQHGPDPSGDSP